MKKEASSFYPSLDRVPKPAFGLQQQAASGVDYGTVDPYNVYQRAAEDQQIASMLATEAGRQALGAQMAIPIRSQLDYQGMCRRFFEIDVLAQGQIARYDKDIDVSATTVTRLGEAATLQITGEYVEPHTFEIFAPAAIRLRDIQQRRFNVLDRMQEKIKIEVQKEEDSNFLALTEASIAANSANNAITASTTGVSKDFLNKLSAMVMRWDLPVYAFLMNVNSYTQIRAWQRNDLDPVTQREIQQTGLMGNIWGTDILVSRLVPDNVVYVYSEPRFTGVLPIRTDLILMPDDEPKKATIGFVGYEEVGMLFVNLNSIAKGMFSGYAYNTAGVCS